MASDLLKDLQTAEETWRASSPEWKRKIQKWEEWKANEKQRQRATERAKKTKKDVETDRTEVLETSWESSFDPQEPLPQFSFANIVKYSNEELNHDIDGLRWTSIEKWIIDALRRGIAIHHAGMNKQYRSLVERYSINSPMDYYSLTPCEAFSGLVTYV
jgi:hypothetical protein